MSFTTMAVEGPERAGSANGVPVPNMTTFVISEGLSSANVGRIRHILNNTKPTTLAPMDLFILFSIAQRVPLKQVAHVLSHDDSLFKKNMTASDHKISFHSAQHIFAPADPAILFAIEPGTI